jgi:hypothetical protein
VSGFLFIGSADGAEGRCAGFVEGVHLWVLRVVSGSGWEVYEKLRVSE